MIVVRVELWSAITGAKTELARMHISNAGGSNRRRDYEGKSFIGRSTEALDRQRVSKVGSLTNFPSLDLHVWNLVARMLATMGYQ